MATSSDGTATFPGEYRTVFDAVCTAAVAERMTIRGADPATGIIAVSSDVSAFSWGENGEIRVWQQEPGTIGVGIQSSLKFGLVDWGRNRKNIERMFARIETVLAAGPPPPPPAGWHPDPTRRHQSRYWDGSAWTPHVSDDGTTRGRPAVGRRRRRGATCRPPDVGESCRRVVAVDRVREEPGQHDGACEAARGPPGRGPADRRPVDRPDVSRAGR